MPYIKQELRSELEVRSPQSVGELNYSISIILNKYIQDYGLCYKTINDLIGSLECSKLELYRRISFYEDKKKESSGDIYLLS